MDRPSPYLENLSARDKRRVKWLSKRALPLARRMSRSFRDELEKRGL
jgi:hypothetical protein